jgi:CPA2 family monovalent cation:H+ antiporter-2
MEPSTDYTFLEEAIVLLLTAVVVVPLFRRFKASPVLGYLLAGVVIGPYGFGIVADVKGVAQFAELGVVFLLFTIGLELSFSRVIALRRYVFGLGTAQVLLSAGALAGLAWYWGNSPRASLILGASLALSSTALVMQLLADRRATAMVAGRVSFAVLLLQDLAVVPLILLVTLADQAQTQPLGVLLLYSLGKAMLAVGVIFLVGRFLLRPLFRVAAVTRGPELFTAMILLVVFATAWITDVAGLSMAFGAFLAGLLLSETEFRHQIETDIEPFKGLLLGVFFISVGMGIDLRAAADAIKWLLPALAGLIVFKTVIMYGLARVFGIARPAAVESALLLAQSGEFAFVILALAGRSGLLNEPGIQFFNILITLSLMMTPILDAIGWRLARRLETRSAVDDGEDDMLADLDNHVLILGFGRVGETVAHVLAERRLPFVGVDSNPERARHCRRRGNYVFFGDATRDELLRRFGVTRAAAVVVSLDSLEQSDRAVHALKRVAPNVPIFARAILTMRRR